MRASYVFGVNAFPAIQKSGLDAADLLKNCSSFAVILH